MKIDLVRASINPPPNHIPSPSPCLAELARWHAFESNNSVTLADCQHAGNIVETGSMDQLSAECFVDEIRGAIYQAMMRGLAAEELVELSGTFEVIRQGIPGDAALNRRVRQFTAAVYASGVFSGTRDLDCLVALVGEAEQILASIRQPSSERFHPVPALPD